MKIALSLGSSEREMRFARQLGLSYVVSHLPANPKGYLELDDLRAARQRFADHGLSFDVIENLPTPHYDKVMFGLPGRDEQIDHVCTTIRNMGEAGISVLQYQWMLFGGLPTEYCPVGRGGARVSRFDWEVAKRSPIAALDWRPGPNGLIHTPDQELGAEQVWDNLTYFLERVVPVAEEAGASRSGSSPPAITQPARLRSNSPPGRSVPCPAQASPSRPTRARTAGMWLATRSFSSRHHRASRPNGSSISGSAVPGPGRSRRPMTFRRFRMIRTPRRVAHE